MSAKLRKIMKLMKAPEDDKDRGIALSVYGQELGVSLAGLWTPNGKLLEPELVSRIINAERAWREERLWVVALAASVASIVSALAAWCAALK